MLCGQVEVTFCVQCNTISDEIVCVTGDCPALGNWKSEGALKLRSFRHATSDENISLWKGKIRLQVNRDLKYRYFKACIKETDHEGDKEDYVITEWESNHLPRQLSTTAFADGKSFVKFGEYGNSDALPKLDEGWLTGQTEVHIRLYSNAVKLWSRKHVEKKFKMKCTPIDLKQKEAVCKYDDEDSTQDIPVYGSANKFTVSVLDGVRDTPVEQDQFGINLNENDYVTFVGQTFDLDHMAYKIDYYVQPSPLASLDIPQHFGSSLLLPGNLRDKCGKKVIPITSVTNKPVGELTVDYLVIKTSFGLDLSMERTFCKYWKEWRTLDVAHRGMGSSYKTPTTRCATVRENTIASLTEAGKHGADYVEFDVQLSKDMVPVIYHDFVICLSMKKKHSDSHELLQVPVKDFTHSQLQLLRVDHKSSYDSSSSAALSDDPIDTQPFPSLKDCLETINPDVGFNIEIKYPLKLLSGGLDEGIDQYWERNVYVDRILKDIMTYAGMRRILITSFDPDVCSMVRRKQNIYPVSLLCGDYDDCGQPLYEDLRTRKFHLACSYANSANLLGINVNTEDILKDTSIVKYAKDRNLILMCWGEDNNNMETFKTLKSLGVDGVIYDRISDFKGHKESDTFEVSRVDQKLLESALHRPDLLNI